MRLSVELEPHERDSHSPLDPAHRRAGGRGCDATECPHLAARLAAIAYPIDLDHFEVRDGVAAPPVRMSGQFVARHESSALAAAMYPNPDGGFDPQFVRLDAEALHMAGGAAVTGR